jgi:hypothetical protein
VTGEQGYRRFPFSRSFWVKNGKKREIKCIGENDLSRPKKNFSPIGTKKHKFFHYRDKKNTNFPQSGNTNFSPIGTKKQKFFAYRNKKHKFFPYRDKKTQI